MGIALTYAQKVREQQEVVYLADFFGSISRLYILEKYNASVFRVLYDRYLPYFNRFEKNKENLEKDLELISQEQTRGIPFSQLTQLYHKINQELSNFYGYPTATYYFEIRKLPRKDRYKLLAVKTQAELVENLIGPHLKKLEQVLARMSGKETTEQLDVKEDLEKTTVPQPEEIQKVEKTEDIFKQIDGDIEKVEEIRKNILDEKKNNSTTRKVTRCTRKDSKKRRKRTGRTFRKRRRT